MTTETTTEMTTMRSRGHGTARNQARNHLHNHRHGRGAPGNGRSRLLRRLLLAGAAALLLPALSPARAEAKLKVVASIETLADLSRQVGGDRVDVSSLSRGVQDPHFVQAKPSLVLVL